MAIDQAAELAHPRDGHKIFAMVACYLDDSGTHRGARVCAAGGFVADHVPWRKFEREWLTLLHRFGVPPERFHARQLYPKPKGWFRNDWPRHADHQKFLDAIVELIARHRQIRPMAVGILVEHFFANSEHTRRWLTGADVRMNRLKSTGKPSAPFFYAVVPILQMACRGWPDRATVHFHIGLGPAHAGYATALFLQIRDSKRQSERWAWKKALGQVAYPPTRKTPPLQAADFLCFVAYREILRMTGNGKNPVGSVVRSEILERLFTNRRDDWAFQIHGDKTLTVVARSAPKPTTGH